jgi:F-type H+-transporting ATPase subunit gamma
MSDTGASLRRKIDSAGELHSVVRTMKAVAASSIGEYEKSVSALADYYRTVEMGLSACFKDAASVPTVAGAQENKDPGGIGAIVFGSDQGLVGQFNEVVADFAIKTLQALSGKVQVWAIGERVQARLADAGLPALGLFAVPNSVKAIAPLVGKIQIESEKHRARGEYSQVYVFHNRPQTGSLYEPVCQQLLPLDAQWQARLAKLPWPTKSVPEVVGSSTAILRALIREYLFISLFRACAESLASENASRLAAMQRADKNIDELMDNLNSSFQRLRQSAIDEELFEVTSSFEALVSPD